MAKGIYTIAQLRADIKDADDSEEVTVVLEDGPNTEPQEWEELEPGSVCTITEAGGYERGMRVIRAFPR